MTVPEENQEKTPKTDPVVEQPDRREDGHQEGAGRSLQEAFEEAGVKPEDYSEK